MEGADKKFILNFDDMSAKGTLNDDNLSVSVDNKEYFLEELFDQLKQCHSNTSIEVSIKKEVNKLFGE
jgi:hypothetical protein